MTWPSHTYVATARSLLAREGCPDADESCIGAAVLVFDKLGERLSPIVGPQGVQALFARSAQLAEPGPPHLRATDLESSTSLAARLRTLPPGKARATCESLIGGFLELLATFIGETLTSKLIQRDWPLLADLGPKGE